MLTVKKNTARNTSVTINEYKDLLNPLIKPNNKPIPKTEKKVIFKYNPISKPSIPICTTPLFINYIFIYSKFKEHCVYLVIIFLIYIV